MGLDHNAIVLSSNRAPFDDKMCDLVVEFHPEVVSFHFGLPDRDLCTRSEDRCEDCFLGDFCGRGVLA
jgi:nitronate monooxygenase